VNVDGRLLLESAEELFEHAPCGFLLTAPDGAVARVNETFLAWTGYARESVLAPRRFADLLTVPGRIFYETHYAPLLRMQGFVREVALDVVCPGRDPLPVLVNSTQKTDAAGVPVLIRTTVFDATDRRAYERELLAARRRAEQLATVVQATNEAILLLGPDGTVHSWNQGARHLFGYTEAEAVSRRLRDLVVPPDQLAHHAELLAAVRSGRPAQAETVRVTKNGRRIEVLISLTPHFGDGGELATVSAIVQDISVRKQTEERLRLAAEAERAARGEAERTNRLKDEFLATVSHELRTPLNAILGWTQVLQSIPTDDPDVAEGLEIIERNTRVQSQLVDDLLDMGRIMSGKIRLDVQPVDLAGVVDGAIETARPAIDARGIRLQKVLDPGVTISGDPGRLQQVFWNLLSNAAKFTPKGGLIRVVMQRVNSHVEVAVVDTGQGMDPAFVAHAFDRFRQADSDAARRTKGLGLGLSIVKNIVEMHGGSIHAHSLGPGTGSRFTVHLPVVVIGPHPSGPERVHPRAALAAAADAVDVGGISLQGVKVLVVDDERDAREMVRRVLAGAGADVRTSASVADGIAAVSEFRPDVLISDIGMPGEDGYAFIQRVRMLGPDAGGNVHAVALTAFARLEDRTRAMMAGFHMHLAKPVDTRELLVTVATLASRAAR
jgi:PAS domain S-box-containing protein